MFDVNLLFLQLIASPLLNEYTVIPNIAKVKYSPFSSDHYSMRNSSAHENIIYINIILIFEDYCFLFFDFQTHKVRFETLFWRRLSQ